MASIELAILDGAFMQLCDAAWNSKLDGDVEYTIATL